MLDSAVHIPDTLSIEQRTTESDEMSEQQASRYTFSLDFGGGPYSAGHIVERTAIAASEKAAWKIVWLNLSESERNALAEHDCIDVEPV